MGAIVKSFFGTISTRYPKTCNIQVRFSLNTRLENRKSQSIRCFYNIVITCSGNAQLSPLVLRSHIPW